MCHFPRGASALLGALARNVSLSTLVLAGNDRIARPRARAAERALARDPPERRRRAWWLTIIARLRYREDRAAADAVAASAPAVLDGLFAPQWRQVARWEPGARAFLKGLVLVPLPVLLELISYL